MPGAAACGMHSGTGAGDRLAVRSGFPLKNSPKTEHKRHYRTLRKGPKNRSHRNLPAIGRYDAAAEASSHWPMRRNFS
jgi:hypothetical protein